MQICRWSRSCPPAARSHQLPAFATVGVSSSQADKHQLCLSLLRSSLLPAVSDGQERFPPSPCTPGGCDLVSCSLWDLKQAASLCCFRLRQQAGDRNHHEPTSHGKTGPKLLDAVMGQACFFFPIPWCKNLNTVIEILSMLKVYTLD